MHRASLVALSLLPLGGCPGSGDKVSDTASCPSWAETYGGSLDDEIWGVAAAGDGGAFVAGFQTLTSQTQAMAWRLDAEGATRWSADWGEDWSEKGFVIVPDGDRVLLGGTMWTSLDLLDTDAFLVALDAEDGGLLGEARWTSEGWDEIDGIVPLDDGLLISGWSGPEEDQDLRVQRLDDALEVVWDQTWGSDGYDELNGHMVVVEDVAYVVGRWDGLGGFLGGDALFAALSTEDGEPLWSLTDGSELGYEDALGLATDGERLYAVGYGDVSGLGKQLLIWALSLDGELLWQVDWGGADTEAGRAITVDPADGALLVAANTWSEGAGDADIALLRLDPDDGEVLDEALFGGAEEDAAHDVAIDGDTVWISAETSSFGEGVADGLVLRGCRDPLSLPDEAGLR